MHTKFTTSVMSHNSYNGVIPSDSLKSLFHPPKRLLFFWSVWRFRRALGWWCCEHI